MKSILIIEDQLELRENLSEILMLSGYEVYAAPDGKSGIKEALENNPDLILCDVMMPDLDGYGVLKIVRDNAQLKNTPFLFLTAKTDERDFRKGMGLGADDYITKPFDDTELLEAIALRIDRRPTNDGFTKHFFNETEANKKLEELLSKVEMRMYPAKSELFSNNGRPMHLFTIKKGFVKELVTNNSGKELIIKVSKPGDYLGLSQLFYNDDTYDHKAVALTDVEVALNDAADVRSLILNSNELAILFTRKIIDSKSKLVHKLMHQSYSSVRKKVANALLEVYHAFDEKELHVGRDVLANLAGTAKETVIRTLSDFKSEGIISIEHNIITLNHIEDLERMPQ